MITPTDRQLRCWCAVHNIQIQERLVARGINGEIIETVKMDELITNPEKALRDACELMAFALCLVSPQQAINL